jgi:hypothetical protein
MFAGIYACSRNSTANCRFNDHPESSTNSTILPTVVVIDYNGYIGLTEKLQSDVNSRKTKGIDLLAITCRLTQKLATME